MAILDNGTPEHRRKIKVERQYDDPNSIGLLTEAEKAVIREKARNTVKLELQKREEDALLAQYIKEEREQVDPKEQLVPIYLTLAGHSNYIMLDGVQFFHERLHWVTPAVFATLAEVQARGWAHEEDTEVRDVSTKRRSRPPPHVGVGNFTDNRQPRKLVTSAAALQGSSAHGMLGIGR